MSKSSDYFVAGLKDANLARRQIGLAPIAKVERICLKCEKKFIAIGRFNRLCQYCGYNAKEYV